MFRPPPTSTLFPYTTLFRSQNALGYLNSTELPLEIARTIFATRDYHVLWTHDFAGRRFSGAIDNIGYSMVADVYLPALDRKSTRLNSSHPSISYAVFCLKKK